MKFINKKYIAIGIITLIVGVLAVGGMSRLLSGSTTVQGTVIAFILNPEGKTEGAVLDTGDQIRFGAETGEIVTGQVKVGDALSATGHGGSKSDYGREFRVETLQIGDQTIKVMHSKPGPPRGGDKPKPHDGDKPKPGPREGKMPPPAPETASAPESNVPPVIPETAIANGQVKIVLVGGRGEPRGLILSTGEQIALPKEVNDASLSYGQDTQVSAEGDSAKSDFGTFIRPTRLTIGNQTFSFNR